MADKEILTKDGVVVEAPKNSTIRPGDIPVKTNTDTFTVLSSVVSGLAALILTKNLEKAPKGA